MHSMSERSRFKDRSEIAAAIRSVYGGGDGPVKAFGADNGTQNKTISGSGLIGSRKSSGLPKLNRFNVRKLNDENLLSASPDRRSMMS